MCEATASWKWFNWLLAQLPPNKQPLLLNMDETACRLFYDPAKGVLASELVALAARRGRVTSSVTTAQTRSVLSLVALLCNDSSIQPRLPQYILGNRQAHWASCDVIGVCRRMYTFCDEKVHGSTTPSLQVSPDIGAESCSSIALIGNPSYCWMLAAHTC